MKRTKKCKKTRSEIEIQELGEQEHGEEDCNKNLVKTFRSNSKSASRNEEGAYQGRNQVVSFGAWIGWGNVGKEQGTYPGTAYIQKGTNRAKRRAGMH